MAINGVVVQYTSEFLPDILLFIQAPILAWFDGTIIGITTILLTLYYSGHVFKEKYFCYDWWPCMVIDISVQYNGGFLPDIVLLTQIYYHWETRLNTT